MKALLAILFLLLPLPSIAMMPVELLTDADDPVGRSIVYQVRENINSSNSLQLTYNQNIPRIQIRIVTMDVWGNGQGTVLSFVVTWDVPTLIHPYHLRSSVVSTGRNNVDSASADIVAIAAEEADKILRALQRSGQP